VREDEERSAEPTEMTKLILAAQTYFRPEEAATYLRVGRTTMFQLLRMDAVPSVRIGGVRLVRKADLDAFVEDRLGAEGSKR